MRAVLDTNVLISALYSAKGPPGRLLSAWVDGLFDLVMSDDVLAEFRRVLGYPKHRHLFAERPAAIAILLEKLRTAIFNGEIPEVPPLESDPSDTMFLALALAAQADVLVSGDSHLLDLGAYEGIPILTPTQFLELLEQERG